MANVNVGAELDLRYVTLEPWRMHISGKATKTNSEGRRNFTIIWNYEPNKEFIDNLIEDGWPIKVEPRSKNNPDDIVARMKVNINFKYGKPPRFTMIQKVPAFDKTTRQQLFDIDANGNKIPLYHIKKTMLDEELSKAIDDYDITDVKVRVNISEYTNPITGATGYTVYLKEMQFVLVDGAFDYDEDVIDIKELRPDLADDLAECPFDVD